MRVLQLWRYPVKSMQGERLDEVAVDGLGLEGDRSHGVVDLGTGLVLTARRDPSLLHAAGRRRDDGSVEVVLPDGRRARDDGDLSAWLGRPVRLAPASAGGAPTYESAVDEEREGADWRRWGGPPGAFHDDGNVRVSLVGAATVAAVGHGEVRRFRPNIVLSEGDEDGLVGHRVRLGGALLDVVQPVARCVVVTRPQPGGISRDLGVLRAVLAERAGALAVGAVVVEAGPVRLGDQVEVVA